MAAMEPLLGFPCDFCKASAARTFCRADAARLCIECDKKARRCAAPTSVLLARWSDRQSMSG